MHPNVKLSAINTHGLKGNLVHIENLIKKNDIIFICEHWLLPSEKYFFDLINNNKTIIFKSSMQDSYGKGRPHGGTCWLINLEIQIMNNEIYNDCINLVKTNINGIVVNLIGVHLMFNNDTKTNQSIYESQLSIVSTLIEEFKYKKEEFLVTGDFNGDILRNNNKFDKLLSLFIQKNNLKSCFDAIKNLNPFSYSNSICNLLIDYILIDKNSSMRIQNCHIEYNVENTSDHNSINANLQINKICSKNNLESPNALQIDGNTFQNRSFRINWNSNIVVREFYNFLEVELQKIKINNIFQLDNNVETRNKMNNIYKDIVECFKKANELTSNLFEKMPRKTAQNWWTKELERMKKAIKEARNDFKFTNDINDKIRVKKCKKEFRKVQRRNMFMYENNRNKNIESLFRISNKEEFWKAFNSCKESDTHIDNVSCKIDSNKDNKRCFDHFNRLFNRNFEDNLFNEQQKEIIREVNLWKERCKNNFSTNDKNYVSSNMIVQCINEMKPSNSAGYDGITNNMLKKSMSDRLICVLKDFINAILCTGVIPENFNRSIIIPIIKDKSKKVFDVNNLRPISVSNCLSQLLERIILYKSKFLNDSSTNQFGFQLGLSTYHPYFY